MSSDYLYTQKNSFSKFNCYEKKFSSVILSDNLAVSIKLLTLGRQGNVSFGVKNNYELTKS